MAVTSNKITITTSPTPLNAPDTDGMNILIRAEDKCYIGKEDVSINTGYQLDADIDLDLFLGPNEIIYGVVEEGTTTVYVLMTLNE